MLKTSEAKSSDLYLRNIDANNDEKISSLLGLINFNKLRKNNEGVIKIVEFGIGGGSQFSLISRYASCNTEIIGADINEGVLKYVSQRNIDKKFNIKLKKIDITNIYEDKISVINASAIFHEVSSYGDYIEKYGEESIKEALKSINKSLINFGYLIYRDLYYPVEYYNGTKKVYYNSLVWKWFYDFFLKDFLKSTKVEFYKSQNIKLNYNESYFVLETDRIIHKEFQRHYLIFRKSLEKGAKDILGIEVLDNYFTKIDEGVKEIIVKIDKKNNDIVDEMLLNKCDRLSSDDNFVYKINSDIYNILLDKIILKFFENQDKHFLNFINEWKSKEGIESYFYADVIDLLIWSIDVTFYNGFVLFIEDIDDIFFTYRNYYNRYLNKNISDPEIDGKQNIIFKKIKISEAYIVAQSLLKRTEFQKSKVIKLIELIKNKI